MEVFGATERELCTATLPMPWLREAEVALDELHESVALPEVVMLEGFAEREHVGRGVGSIGVYVQDGWSLPPLPPPQLLPLPDEPPQQPPPKLVSHANVAVGTKSAPPITRVAMITIDCADWINDFIYSC